MTAAAPAGVTGADDSLAGRLGGTPWTWYAEPFPHIVARDVFVPELQARLEDGFAATLREHVRDERPRRYDADIVPFTGNHRARFPLILDPAFHRLLARVTGVRASGDIDGGIHRHAVGSASGWVHNDLNPGWFTPSDHVPNFSDHARGGYKNGDGAPAKRVRACAMIYFLCNGTWREGDGGETGLYAYETQPVEAPSKRIPPLDNSLLLFRCTPHSYHAFLSNVRSERNSIILWLHEDASIADARWGRGSLVGWE